MTARKTVSFISLLSALLMVLMLMPEANAGMYVCIDSAGKAHYTNIISSGNCRPLRGTTGISKRPGGAPARRSTTLRQRRKKNSSSYDHHISRSSQRYNVDPYLIKAVIKTESNFDCYALSRQGAQGLMQLMPATARELRVRDPFNPHQNIDGGTRYLRSMLDIFDGNVPLSLAAYNAGPTLVKRINRIPRIPETIRYVQKVLAAYKGYRGYIPRSSKRIAATNTKSRK